MGEWPHRAASQAEGITEALVHELELSDLDVDAVWRLVNKSAQSLQH